MRNVTNYRSEYSKLALHKQCDIECRIRYNSSSGESYTLQRAYHERMYYVLAGKLSISESGHRILYVAFARAENNRLHLSSNAIYAEILGGNSHATNGSFFFFFVDDDKKRLPDDGFRRTDFNGKSTPA